MQIDLLKYAALKAKGGLQLTKMGDSAVLFVQKFDPDTGEARMPDMGPINLAEVLAVKATLQAQLDGLNQLLADMAALGVPTKLPPPKA